MTDGIDISDQDWPTTEDCGDWDMDEDFIKFEELEETVPKLLEDPYVAAIHDKFMEMLAEEKAKQLQKDYELAFEIQAEEAEKKLVAENKRKMSVE